MESTLRPFRGIRTIDEAFADTRLEFGLKAYVIRGCEEPPNTEPADPETLRRAREALEQGKWYDRDVLRARAPFNMSTQQAVRAFQEDVLSRLHTLFMETDHRYRGLADPKKIDRLRSIWERRISEFFRVKVGTPYSNCWKALWPHPTFFRDLLARRRTIEGVMRGLRIRLRQLWPARRGEH